MRCEEFVNEYMPTVKSNIAYILYNKYDLKQVEISEILDITQPAVSQYIRGSRGKTTELSKEMEKTIEKVAEEIYRTNKEEKLTQKEVDDLMCEICKKI